jgi:hypothetical protein
VRETATGRLDDEARSGLQNPRTGRALGPVNVEIVDYH